MLQEFNNFIVPLKYYSRDLPDGKLYTYKGAYISLSYDCNIEICEYCYARGQCIRGKMSQSDFSTILDWLGTIAEIREIQLVGGEPTLLHNLSEYLNIAKLKKFKTTVYTNGYFSLNISRMLRKHSAVSGIIFHYEPDFFRKIKDYERVLNQNLSTIHGYKHLELIYCISELNFEYNGILQLAQKYDLNIRWIFSTPTSCNTPYLSLKDIKMAAPRLKSFLSECLRMGIVTKPDLCVPLCIFEDPFFQMNSERLNLVKRCFPFVSIDPDLTANFCTSIPSYRSPRLASHEDLKQAIEKFRSIRQSLSGVRPFPECSDCRLYEISCQGGCLTYRIFHSNE